MVLVAVAVTWRAVTVPVNRATLSAAGFASGITGTATSIGGPPIAIVYQHRPPQEIRTTMAVYFLIGAALSLVALLVTGDLTGHQAVAAVELLPLLALGAALGALARQRLPGARRAPGRAGHQLGVRARPAGPVAARLSGLLDR